MKRLDGQRILVTRAVEQAGALSRLIVEQGGQPVEIPLIKTVLPQDSSQLKQFDDTLHRLADFQWGVLTSTNGVKFFFQRLKQLHIDASLLNNIRWATVGSKTKEKLEQEGLTVEVMPRDFHAEGLLQAMAGQIQQDDRILFPRGNLARPILLQHWREQGFNVTDVIVYETIVTREGKENLRNELKERALDAVTFTSPSTVQNFVTLVEEAGLHPLEMLDGVKLVCIGPVTQRAAERLGLPVDAVADPYTMEGIVQALIGLWQK